MKFPSSLDVNRLLPARVPFGLRAFFRGVFLLLALATLALAVAVLQDEKERSYRNYQDGFKKTRRRSPPGCATRPASWCCSTPPPTRAT